MRPERSNFAVTLVVLLAVIAAGCASGQPDDGLDDDLAAEPADAAQAESGAHLPEGFADVSELQRYRVQASVEGAVEFVYDGEEDVHVTHAGGPGMQTNVFSMGFVVPVKLADPAERFRWGVDLLHAYAGPGRYEFGPEAEQGLRNIVQLVYLRAKDPTAEALYDPDEAEAHFQFHEIRQPCVLEAREPEYAGTLTCPELADGDGRTVSLTISWDHPNGP